MIIIYNAMKASKADSGSGAGKMFFRSMVMLYNGELHILCNCKKKVVFELFVLRLACSHSLAKMEKSKDVCLSMLFNGDSDKFMMMVCRKLAKGIMSNSVFTL